MAYETLSIATAAHHRIPTAVPTVPPPPPLPPTVPDAHGYNPAHDHVCEPVGLPSPHTLQQQLLAEIRMLEQLEDSRVQLLQLEETRAVAQARAHATSTAQDTAYLLAVQQAHVDQARELQAVSLKLHEEQRQHNEEQMKQMRALTETISHGLHMSLSRPVVVHGTSATAAAAADSTARAGVVPPLPSVLTKPGVRTGAKESARSALSSHRSLAAVELDYSQQFDTSVHDAPAATQQLPAPLPATIGQGSGNPAVTTHPQRTAAALRAKHHIETDPEEVDEDLEISYATHTSSTSEKVVSDRRPSPVVSAAAAAAARATVARWAATPSAPAVFTAAAVPPRTATHADDSIADEVEWSQSMTSSSLGRPPPQPATHARTTKSTYEPHGVTDEVDGDDDEYDDNRASPATDVSYSFSDPDASTASITVAAHPRHAPHGNHEQSYSMHEFDVSVADVSTATARPLVTSPHAPAATSTTSSAAVRHTPHAAAVTHLVAASAAVAAPASSATASKVTATAGPVSASQTKPTSAPKETGDVQTNAALPVNSAAGSVFHADDQADAALVASYRRQLVEVDARAAAIREKYEAKVAYVEALVRDSDLSMARAAVEREKLHVKFGAEMAAIDHTRAQLNAHLVQQRWFALQQREAVRKAQKHADVYTQRASWTRAQRKQVPSAAAADVSTDAIFDSESEASLSFLEATAPVHRSHRDMMLESVAVGPRVARADQLVMRQALLGGVEPLGPEATAAAQYYDTALRDPQSAVAVTEASAVRIDTMERELARLKRTLTDEQTMARHEFDHAQQRREVSAMIVDKERRLLHAKRLQELAAAAAEVEKLRARVTHLEAGSVDAPAAAGHAAVSDGRSAESESAVMALAAALAQRAVADHDTRMTSTLASAIDAAFAKLAPFLPPAADRGTALRPSAIDRDVQAAARAIMIDPSAATSQKSAANERISVARGAPSRDDSTDASEIISFGSDVEEGDDTPRARPATMSTGSAGQQSAAVSSPLAAHAARLVATGGVRMASDLMGSSDAPTTARTNDSDVEISFSDDDPQLVGRPTATSASKPAAAAAGGLARHGRAAATIEISTDESTADVDFSDAGSRRSSVSGSGTIPTTTAVGHQSVSDHSYSLVDEALVSGHSVGGADDAPRSPDTAASKATGSTSLRAARATVLSRNGRVMASTTANTNVGHAASSLSVSYGDDVSISDEFGSSNGHHRAAHASASHSSVSSIADDASVHSVSSSKVPLDVVSSPVGVRQQRPVLPHSQDPHDSSTISYSNQSYSFHETGSGSFHHKSLNEIEDVAVPATGRSDNSDEDIVDEVCQLGEHSVWCRHCVCVWRGGGGGGCAPWPFFFLSFFGRMRPCARHVLSGP
jgi:hypothetical protein